MINFSAHRKSRDQLQLVCVKQKSGGWEERNQQQETGGNTRGGDWGQKYGVMSSRVIREHTHTHTQDSCFWWSSHSTEVGAVLKTPCQPRMCKSRPHHLTLWKLARWRWCSLTSPPAGPFEGPSQESPTGSEHNVLNVRVGSFGVKFFSLPGHGEHTCPGATPHTCSPSSHPPLPPEVSGRWWRD